MVLDGMFGLSFGNMGSKGISSPPIVRVVRNGGVHRHHLFMERRGPQAARPVVTFFKSESSSADAVQGDGLKRETERFCARKGCWAMGCSRYSDIGTVSVASLIPIVLILFIEKVPLL